MKSEGEVAVELSLQKMERTRSLGRESKKSFVFSSKTWLELEVEDKRGVSSLPKLNLLGLFMWLCLQLK